MALRKLKGHGKAFAAVWPQLPSAFEPAASPRARKSCVLPAAQTSGLRLWFDGFASFSPVEAELLRGPGPNLSGHHYVVDTSARTNSAVRRCSGGCERNCSLTGAPRHPRSPSSAPSQWSARPTRSQVALSNCMIVAKGFLEIGVGFREIAVGLRDAETYLPLLRGTLRTRRYPGPLLLRDIAPAVIRPHGRSLSGADPGNVLEGWEFGAALGHACGRITRWGSGASGFRPLRLQSARSDAGTRRRSLAGAPVRRRSPRATRSLRNASRSTAGRLKKAKPSAWAEAPFDRLVGNHLPARHDSTRRAALQTWKRCAVQAVRAAHVGRMPAGVRDRRVLARRHTGADHP